MHPHRATVTTTPTRRGRRLTIAVAALALAVLAGCGDDAKDKSTADNSFAKKVRPELSEERSKALSGDDLVAIAKDACRYMENGYAYDLAQARVEEKGKLTPAEADHLLRAATAEYCPEYQPDTGP